MIYLLFLMVPVVLLLLLFILGSYEPESPRGAELSWVGMEPTGAQPKLSPDARASKAQGAHFEKRNQTVVFARDNLKDLKKRRQRLRIGSDEKVRDIL